MRHRAVAFQVTLWALVGVGMTGLAVGRSVSAAKRQPLPVYGTVPAFALRDQAGRDMTHKDLDGAIWVADFIFTSCAGQCLLMSDQMRALQRGFAGEPSLRFVSFSVDPLHDTPERLASYAQGYGSDARWVLLTGDPAQIRSVSMDGFHLAIAERPGAAHEPIVHSVRFVLIDRHRRIRGYYNATDSRAMSRLRQDARQLIQQEE